MPPTTVRSNRETRVSHRKRFTFALGTNQNRCDRSKGDAYRHQYSQNCPNVAGGLDGANLANGRAYFTGRGRFFKTFIAALADSTAQGGGQRLFLLLKQNEMNKEKQTSDKPQNGNDFIADVMSSISLMDKAMKSWHETLKENAEDGKSYSKGLLKGYEGAMNQFQNFFKEYCS